MNHGITVFGAEWCHDTQRTREYLEGLGVAYHYVDIDEDEDAERMVIDTNGGHRRIPLVVVNWREHEQVLRVPSNEELRRVVNAMERDAGDSAA